MGGADVVWPDVSWGLKDTGEPCGPTGTVYCGSEPAYRGGAAYGEGAEGLSVEVYDWKGGCVEAMGDCGRVNSNWNYKFPAKGWNISFPAFDHSSHALYETTRGRASILDNVIKKLSLYTPLGGW